jgi:hypothetical protein
MLHPEFLRRVLVNRSCSTMNSSILLALYRSTPARPGPSPKRKTGRRGVFPTPAYISYLAPSPQVHLSSGLVGRNLMSTPSSSTETTERWTKKRLSLVIVAVGLCFIAWLAFRTLRGVMMLGDVDSAIIRVRAVAAAETKFAKSHPELGYTCTLSQLPYDELVARLVDNAHDNGYSFGIVGCQAPDPRKPNSMYHITARPLHSGLPAFCSDSSGVVRSDDTGSVERCLASGVALNS